MATFLNGVTDYVTQTHPTQSNLAFDQQMLQTKESAYVAGHKKINDLYGSILNSDMSRAENVAARDEFFKVINHDIKKMGGLDFSLDTNVQAAANVFQSIYTNKNIVKDMVWTKNYNNEIGKAESFKNCIDPEKCGGQFWQEGVDALNYRMEEFKGLNSTEAMSYGDVTYVPYNKVFDKALTYFKASGLKMSTDKLSEDGRYMVTTTNGTQLINPLTALFTKALADDPKFTEMYATKAFVERKGWMRGKINNGEYKDENDAMVGYMNSQHKVYTDKIDRAASTLKIDKDILDSREILALQQSSKEANDYLEYVNKVSANRNNNMSIISAGNLLDQQAGASFMMDEIQDSAKILAYSDYSTKKEVDAYKLNEIEFSQKLTIENKRIAADKEIQKMKNDAAEATAKAPKDKSDELNEQREAIALMENGADTKKIGFISNAIIANGAGPIDDVEIGKMLADYKAGKSTNENVKSGIAAYESTLKKEKMKYNGLLKEQQDPYIYPDVVSPSELAGNTYYDQEQTKTFLKKRLENANIKHEDKDVDAFAEYVRAQPDYANIPYATHASNYYKKLTKK
jgi:hypothetical protein